MAKDVVIVSPAEPVTVSVTGPAQMQVSSDLAREYSGALGFTPYESEEIALAVAELASNLIKHAGHGEIKLAALHTDKGAGIEVVSEDDGPGLPDIERAMADGFSTAGTLGTGLGAVNRLMDHVEFSPRAKGGLRITCRRTIRPSAKTLAGRRLEFGAATRAYRMLPENGDAFIILQWQDHALAGIVDGLGHGELAQRAAQAARQYVEHHFDQSLESLFCGVGHACRATRGVVMALVCFDLARKKLRVASVGNVEVHLVADIRFRPVIRRGILGQSAAPNPVPTEHPWSSDSILILHSDGIQSHWKTEDVQRLSSEKPAAIARRLLELYGRPDDDATVLVIRDMRL